jgi:UDPglucose 6-dehydrogenase
MKAQRIGFIGLGKLGLPVALAIENNGHTVCGYDVNKDVAKYLEEKKIPYREEGAEELLQKSQITFEKNIETVVQKSDIIFIPVQTPHDARFEGITRLPRARADFNYKHLIRATYDVIHAIEKQGMPKIVCIISTVLPGTIKRTIKPVMDKANEFGQLVNLVYTPQFIAMGTTINDFLNPEFTLLGVNDEKTADTMQEFFEDMTGKPTFRTDISTAEGIKVFYNTFITMKTVLANIYGEMAEKLNMNVDDIYKALSMADKRIISNKYLKAGMGDGGGCHPRDNIALSWVAKQNNLSFDIFTALMKAREAHVEWQVDLIVQQYEKKKLPILILGKTFKPETNIVTGSPAILLANLLAERELEFAHYDPYVDSPTLEIDEPHIIFLATDHPYDLGEIPTGSILIDPFGSTPDLPGVKVMRLGRP